MVGLRIAAQTAGFAQPFRKALHTVAQMGCDGVQIDARNGLRPAELSDTGVRQLRKLLDDLNLRVGSVAFPTRRGLSGSDRLQQRVEGVIAAMHFASQLGARILVTPLGELPESETANERSNLQDVLGSLAAQSNRLGVRLALQTSAASPQMLADFLDSLPESTAGLDLHPGQLMSHGHSPREFVDIVGQHITHVHAVDAVRDLSSGTSDEVELGRGTVDFPELLGMLEEYDYRDWITIERRNSTQPIQDVSNAVQFLRSL